MDILLEVALIAQFHKYIEIFLCRDLDFYIID